MYPSKMQTELKENSRKCIVELNKFKKDFNSAVTGFLTANQKNCLLVETRDAKLGAIRIMHLLEQMEEGQTNEKALGRYLGAENQTFLHWEQLLDTVGTEKDLPSFTNLLVCMFPDGESRKIENTEEEVFRKISDRLKITVLKKVIFVTSQKGELNEYLKEIDTKTFLKIDEFENKVTSVIGDGRTSLLDKASRGDVNGLEELIKHGIDVNVTIGEDNLTALHVAAEKGHLNVVSTLLKNKADILPNKSGDTPLHTAANKGLTDVVRVLLETGIEVDIGGQKGQTALFQAAANGHADVIKILLQYNGNINDQNNQLNNNSYAPLHIAAMRGRQDIVLMLLENGADIDIRDSLGETALHMATREYPRTIKTFLEHGANIEARDNAKITPLHRAVISNNKKAINTLLEYKADINATNILQNNALYYAVMYCQLDTVKVLIEKGIKVHSKNTDGKTALDFAVEYGKDQIASLLKTI